MDGTNKALFGPGGNCDRFALEGNKNSLQAPAWVRSNGLDAYEYEAGRGVPRNLSILQAVGDEARKNGIHMSFHAPYFISLSSESPETQEQNLRIITESLQAAEAVGARTIVVHSGGAGKADRRDAMKRSLDMLVRIASLSVPNGLKIGIETMGKINQLGTVDEVIEQCLVCPDLFVPVVDFGHLNARENGCFAVPDDYTRVFERIARSLGDETARYMHCHFSKIEYTEAGEKRHLTFADNQYGPPYEPFACAIAQNGLCPTVICESAGTQTDDALLLKQCYLDQSGKKSNQQGG